MPTPKLRYVGRLVIYCLGEASRDGNTEFSTEEFSCAYFREIKLLPTHLVTFPCKIQQPPTYTHISIDLATHLWELFVSKIFDQTNDNNRISDFLLGTQIYPHYRLKDIEPLIIQALLVPLFQKLICIGIFFI